MTKPVFRIRIVDKPGDTGALYHAELVNELRRLAAFLVIILQTPGCDNLREVAQRHFDSSTALLASLSEQRRAA